MAEGFVTRGLRLASQAVSGGVWLVHRRLTGSSTVLEVRVSGTTDARSFQVGLARLAGMVQDPGVKGLLLWLDGGPTSWSRAEDLRALVARVRASGRRVWVHAQDPGNAAVWVGAAADRFVVSPSAELQVSRPGLQATYFGEALDRLGLEADVEAAGAYKSVGETFTRTHASAASREALEALLASVERHFIQTLADDRGLSTDAVTQLLARPPLGGADAVEAGLLDGLSYADELRAEVEDHLGDEGSVVEASGWLARQGLLAWVDGWGRRSRVAVVHLEGPIVGDDESGRTAIRARPTASLLASLVDDDRVSAVVLSVNSPGGSASASDRIWREVARLVDAKPVVAFYGDVSASGGVYLSAAVRHIVARPTTLTGSIGVVGGKVVAAGAMRRLGVVAQSFGHADQMLSPAHRFSPDERQRFRASLQRMYDGFVERVAAGRGMSVDEVEPHCRGRVWSGLDAVELGLVDALGGLDDAIAHARSEAGLERADGRRLDMSPASPRPWASLLWSWLSRRLPVGARALAEVDAALWLLDRHPGQALALLPFSFRQR